MVSEYLENPSGMTKKIKQKWKSPAIFDQTNFVKRRAFTWLESWESVEKDDYLWSSSACNDSKERKKT